ncbi:MAG: type II secretion system protein GspC [Pseudomonadota bacterium]
MWKKLAGELLDRYILVVDGIIIVLLAAFVAAAVDQVISVRIDNIVMKFKAGKGDKTTQGKTRPAKPLNKVRPYTFMKVDGKAILARNFFDSITGPLDEDQEEFTMEDFMQDEPAYEGTALPPKCSMGQVAVVGLFASDDPDWSFAAVEMNKNTEILSIGDGFQGHVVNDISWKYLFLSPLGSTKSCYLDIWKEELEGVGSAPPSPIAGRISEKAAQNEPGEDPKKDRMNLQKMMNKSIDSVSDTEKNIDRQLIDYFMENKQMLMQSGRILPNIVNDEISGFKVYGIRKTSLWGKIGIQNGDIINSVNGISFTGPEAAWQAWSKLSGSEHLTVNISRRGQDMNLDLNIQ